MGLGDFLSGAGDAIASWWGDITNAWDDRQALLDRQTQENNARFAAGLDDASSQRIVQDFQRRNPDVDLAERPGFVESNLQTLGSAASVAMEFAPLDLGDDVLEWLSLGARVPQTALIAASHIAAPANRFDRLKETFEADTWSRAWDMTSADAVDGVTGGQVVAFDPLFSAGLDPFDEAQAKQIREGANATWYQTMISGGIDLATSLVAPPGTGVAVRAAKAARTAKTVSTAAQAERVAAEFNTAGVTMAKVGAGQKSRDVLNIMTPGREQNLQSQVRRAFDGVEKNLAGVTDEFTAADRIKAMAPEIVDADAARLANVFVAVNKSTVLDAAAKERVRFNTFLAAMDSPTARKALVDEAPALAKNFERMGRGGIPEAEAMSMLYTSRLDGREVTVNDVIDEVWGRPGDRLELEGLTAEAASRAGRAQELAELRRGISDARPVTRDSLDDNLLRELRASSRAKIRNLLDEREQVTARLRGARRSAGRSLQRRAADDVAERRAAIDNEIQSLSRDLEAARADRSGGQRWASADENASNTPEAGLDNRSVGAAGERVKQLQDRLKDAHRRRRTVESDSAHVRPAEVAESHEGLGRLRQRLDEIEDELVTARADRDLFDGTPLPSRQALSEWRDARGAAVDAEKQAVMESRWADATLRQFKEQVAAKQERVADLEKSMDAANALLNDILDIAGPSPVVHVPSMSAQPLAVESAKRWVRDRFGAEKYVVLGDGNRIVRARSLPSRAARAALAPSARGAISLREVTLGARQLADAMRRSRVFTGDEITDYRSLLIRTPDADRGLIVDRLQDEMVTRVALDFLRKEAPDITRDEAKRAADQIRTLTVRHFKSGNTHVSRAVNGASPSERFVTVTNIDGPVDMYNGPMLRSQLNDTAPLLDPEDLRRALRHHRANLLDQVRDFGHGVSTLHDYAVSIWKYGALFRPGLATRSMLDTGPRVLAMLSAFESFATGVNGAVNVMHNRGLQGLMKARLSGLTPEQAAERMRFLGTRTVRVGKNKYEVRFAEDAADLSRNLQASTRGNTIFSNLFHDMHSAYGRFKVDRGAWSRMQPDDPQWHVGYKEYTQQLLASPAVRQLADVLTKPADGAEVSRMERFMRSPEFKAEYRLYAQPRGMDEGAYLSQMIDEVGLAFPDRAAFDAARRGGLSQTVVDRVMPAGRRYEIPAPELSVLSGFERFQRLFDKGFRVLLDKPDMWLARDPIAVTLFHRYARREFDDYQKLKGPDYLISGRESMMLQARARGKAIGRVRNTLFDTTRYTGAHRTLARFSPFIAAWEDAMIHWGRLIYNDPRRLQKLWGAYHAPFTVQRSANTALVVDYSGNPITDSSDSDDGVYVAVPPAVPFFGGYRMRLDAVNSIAQGDTFWLPGVGPTVAAPAAYALGSGKVIPRDVALDVVDTDSWMGREILKSVFLGGEVPPSDPASLAQSALPGWVKSTFTTFFGPVKIATRQTNYNDRVRRAIANGEVLTPDRHAELWEAADDSANAAAFVRLVASAGFGMTGSATVDGTFYAEQMRMIAAMTPDMRGGLTPEAYFAEAFPDAADLEWGVTRNETGIVASVNAAKAEARYHSMLSRPENKTVGWMIVGAENMIDPEFSRTAYNMQRSGGSRRYQTAMEVMQNTQAQVGYKQYRAWSQQLLDQLRASGMDETSPEYRAGRRAIREYLMSTNPAYLEDQNTHRERFKIDYAHAKRLSSSGPIKDRSDMAAFRVYDESRSEIMRAFDVKSFSGTQPQYEQAKMALSAVGEQLAERDLGFQQLWERLLSREVD